MNGFDRYVARQVEIATADYKRAAEILGKENTQLRREVGGVRGKLKQTQYELKLCRERSAPLPWLDMNDPQIVDKLLATAKGMK